MAYYFSFTGILEIEEGLSMNNPKFTPRRVIYDLHESTYLLQIDFTEGDGIYPTSRNYPVENKGEDSLSMSVIVSFINNHPVLQQFAMLTP